MRLDDRRVDQPHQRVVALLDLRLFVERQAALRVLALERLDQLVGVGELELDRLQRLGVGEAAALQAADVVIQDIAAWIKNPNQPLPSGADVRAKAAFAHPSAN